MISNCKKSFFSQDRKLQIESSQNKAFNCHLATSATTKFLSKCCRKISSTNRTMMILAQTDRECDRDGRKCLYPERGDSPGAQQLANDQSIQEYFQDLRCSASMTARSNDATPKCLKQTDVVSCWIKIYPNNQVNTIVLNNCNKQ